jgi:cell division protein FtsI/penicillin-binding protein 2
MLTQERFRPLNKHKGLQEKWEKRDREEVTAEKEATLEAAEEEVEEAMAESEEVEATAAAVAAEGMIAERTAGKTGTADQHQSKKVKKSTSPSTLLGSEETE